MRKVFRQVITGLVWSRRDGGDMLARWLQTLIRKSKVEGGRKLHLAPQPRGGKKPFWSSPRNEAEVAVLSPHAGGKTGKEENIDRFSSFKICACMKCCFFFFNLNQSCSHQPLLHNMQLFKKKKSNLQWIQTFILISCYHGIQSYKTVFIMYDTTT